MLSPRWGVVSVYSQRKTSYDGGGGGGCVVREGGGGAYIIAKNNLSTVAASSVAEASAGWHEDDWLIESDGIDDWVVVVGVVVLPALTIGVAAVDAVLF